MRETPGSSVEDDDSDESVGLILRGFGANDSLSLALILHRS